MSFADAGRSEEDHVLAALDEAELVQALDLLALDRGLEGKVELLDRLDRRQARGSHGGLQPSVIAQVDLRPKEALERFAGGDGAAVDVGEDVIDRFQCTGEL